MDERDDELAKFNEVLQRVFNRLGDINMHLQMIDRNLEKLFLLALQINGQLPDRDE